MLNLPFSLLGHRMRRGLQMSSECHVPLDDDRYTPTMTVLVWRASWVLSMEGMVPDIERSLVWTDMVVERELDGRWMYAEIAGRRVLMPLGS
jgi:hypothetical protein